MLVYARAAEGPVWMYNRITGSVYRVLYDRHDHVEGRNDNKDTRVDATFDEALDALTKPVRLRYVKRPKARR